jgi:lipoate-protein ligase A
MSTAEPWRCIRSGPGAPAFNLACDEALLEQAHAPPVLRLYAWTPAALSLGRFQPDEPFREPAARAGAVLVRRPTGGGAIHHDRELTFAFVGRPGHDGYPAAVEEAYTRVHAGIAQGLSALGVQVAPRGGDAPRSVSPRAATLCFEDTTAFDLVDAGGRKLVGSAQRRTSGRVLHHGSIPLSAPALTPDCAAIDDLAGRDVSWDELADVLIVALAAELGLVFEPAELDESTRIRAEELAATRYGSVSAARRGRTSGGT